MKTTTYDFKTDFRFALSPIAKLISELRNYFFEDSSRKLYRRFVPIAIFFITGNSNLFCQTALQFNGTNQYVTFGAATSTLGAQTFTLECWFKWTGSGATTSTGTGGVLTIIPLVSKGRGEAEGSNVDANYILGIQGGKLAADFEDIDAAGIDGDAAGQNQPILGTITITTNVWHHAAATFDGTFWKLYLDGVLDNSLDITNPGFALPRPQFNSIQHAGIATAMTSTGSAAGFFAGVIDEARIWSVARTQSEIQASMNYELTSGTGLIGRWGLNQGSGSTATNSIAGSPNGTLTNTPTWVTGAPLIPNTPSVLNAVAVSAFRIDLSWTDNSNNETGFEIERSTTGIGGSYTLFTTVAANAVSYSNISLTPNTEYCYRVRAVNGTGLSGYAGPVCTTTPSEGDYALDFGTSSAYITLGAAPSLNASAFTLEAWIMIDGAGSTTTTSSTGGGGFVDATVVVPLVTKGRGEGESPANINMNYFMGLVGNKLAADFEEAAGPNHSVVGNATIPLSTWTHVAATYEPVSGVWNLFVNGQLDATFDIGDNILPSNTSIQHSAFGSALTSTGSAAGFFNGRMDEVRIWNYARTLSEIQSSINSQITLAQSGLLGRWGFNDVTGTIVNGNAGTNLSGTISGSGSTWITPGAPYNILIPPNAPVQISPADLSTGISVTPDLSWNASATATSYEAQVSTTSNFAAIDFSQSGIATTSVSVSPALSINTTYYWRVRAANASGNGAWSDTRSFITVTSASPFISIAGTPLNPFSSPTGTQSAVQSYSVSAGFLTDSLLITAPADFEISSIFGGDYNPTVTLYPSSGTIPSTTIYVHFNRATPGTTNDNISHTSTGAIAQNVAVSGTATTPPNPPIEPSSLSAVAFSSIEIDLQWTDNSNNETNFEIERSTTGIAGTYSLLTTVSANSTFYNDLAVTGSNEYCYRIRAVNADGPSVYAGNVCATTPNSLPIVFQDGLNGYNGTRDSYTYDVSPSTSHGSETVIVQDKDPGNIPPDERKSLLMFDLSSVPATAEIQTAQVQFYVESEGQGFSMHRMLVSWNEATTTYSSIGNRHYLPNNTDAESSVNANWTGVDNYVGSITVTIPASTIQGWLDGTLTNNGWLIIATHADDGQQLSSRESSTQVNRPKLILTYEIPEVNLPPSVPVNISPANNGNSSSTSPNICATVSDPNGGNLQVQFYGRPKSGGSGAKFSIIGLPDTQFYTEQPQGANSSGGGHNGIFKAQTQWIANHRIDSNIVFVTHLGDCAQNGDANLIEWQRADTSCKLLEFPNVPADGVPYGICVGNHDQGPIGSPDGTTNYYNQFFGQSRFNGRNYYGGHYGSNNDNHYELFSGGGIDFINISIEYYANGTTASLQQVLNWADALMKTHSNRKAIVSSHNILGTGNPGNFQGPGQKIYDELKDNPNFFLMLAGHVPGEGRRMDVFNGDTVYTLMSDYQSGYTNGGNGYLRIMSFFPDQDKMLVKTYSPYSNTFFTGASSQFTIPVNLEPAQPFTLLGTNFNVGSGTTTCFQWPSLIEGDDYEWYVVVSDGEFSTTGPVWAFTATGSVPPSVTTEPISQNKCSGTIVSFISAANGDPTPTVQWQVSTNNGASWNDISGATNATLSFTTGVGDNGKKYRAIWTNSVSADTTVAVTLTINGTATSSSTPITACNTYTWNGIPHTTSGSYTTTGLTNVEGCDSSATVVLTINNSTHNSSHINGCFNYVWSGGTGINYTTSGTYLYTYTNGAGCASADTLHLTISSTSESSTSVTTCNSYVWNGITHSSSGTYTTNGLISSGGCDSSATVILTIIPCTSSGVHFSSASQQLLTLDNDPTLHLTNFTLEAWIKIEGPGVAVSSGSGGVDIAPILSKGKGETEDPLKDENYIIGYNAANNKLAADFEDNITSSNHPVISRSTLSNCWTHVAASYNVSSHTWKLYINGILDTTLVLGSNYVPQSLTNVDGCIGSTFSSTNTFEGFFDGKIDEVRIWNVVRTDAEIFANYNSEILSGPGLVSRWGMNEGSGTLAENSVPTGPVASLYNNASWTSGFEPGGVSRSNTLITTCESYTWNGSTYSASGTYTISGLTGSFGCDSSATLLLTIVPCPTTSSSVTLLPANSQHVSLGNDPSLHLTDFTLEAWIKIEGTGINTSSSSSGGLTNIVPIISKGRAESESAAVDINYIFGYDLSTKKLNADFEDNATSGNHPVVGNAVLGNCWTHVAATYNTATNTWKLYVNGVLDRTLDLGSGFTPQSLSDVNACIGSSFNSSGTAAGFFPGRIDEVRIWSVVRSDAEILANFNAELTSGNGLVSRWGFNEGSGNFSENSIVGNPDANLINSPSWATGFNQSIIYGTNLDFNGTSDYVTFGAAPSLNASAFTLEAWIKIEGAGATTTTSGAGGGGFEGATAIVPIISKGRGEAESPANLNLNYIFGLVGNKLAADFEEGTGANHSVVGNAIVPSNVWTHVAATYEPVSAVWNLYINGALDKTLDIGSNILPSNTCIQHSAVGSALTSTGSAGGFFNGKIDEVRIWNVQRAGSEILTYYPFELSSGTGLIGHWNFNDGCGLSASNSVNGGVTGTLSSVTGPVWATGNFGTVPVVTSDPLSQTMCTGSSASFFSTASGIPVPTAQWQFSSNGGGSWTNLGGATSAALIFIVNSADVGKQYRAIWANPSGADTSATAILTVNITDDNNLCTADACNSSTGDVTHSPVNPDDGNICTTDGCNSATGVYNDPLNYDDGNACTLDGCNTLTGVFNNPIDTDDGNICTTDGCDTSTGVYHNPVNTDDGNACTADGCDTSTGIFHDPLNTNDGNVCTIDGCDPSTGVYHNAVDPNDGNACTVDVCSTLTGVKNEPIDPDDGNTCTTDGCDTSTGVYHDLLNTDDGNACTIDGCDTSTGVYHNLLNTDDGNACTNDGCDISTGVYNNPINSNDGNACTTDGCDSLTGVYNNSLNTDDGNACTIDGCNTMTGVITHSILPGIDDGIACTLDECNSSNGQITHTSVNCGVTLNMKMFIQGFYNAFSGKMDVGHPDQGLLNILDPSELMYSANPEDVDDVTITAMDPAPPYDPVESKVGRLKINGEVTVTFTGPATAGNSYYLRITHRNLVETWSHYPVLFSAITTYDFTTASTQAYDDGFNIPMQQSTTGVWLCFNGDIDQDGGLTSLDMTAEEIDANAGAFGYNATDLDGDGESASLDMTLIENNSSIGVFMMRP